jgi:alkanesulfonate monooxygenase SsuD/methylene tetrahydromethanopterin reductase-like flavin-dependent oxidoreductase (luciferase family)
MRVGISIASSHSVEDPNEGSSRMIERAQAAERAGLDTLTLGDHHARTSPYFQNTPMLGRLLAEWTGQAGCLFLAPLWNPVLMAEHIATLASLSTHRFIVQVGVGNGADQFAAMGADLRTRGRDTEATIGTVSRLLAGERDSELGIHDAVISPTTVQPVEWWIGAGAPRSLDRAARLGEAWYCGPNAPPDVAKELLEQYRAARASHGLDEGRAIIRRDMIISGSGAAAENRGRDLIDRGYRGLPWEAVVCGDPSTVAEQLDTYRSAGFSEVVARCMFVPQAVALETVELLGEVRRLLKA